MLHKASHHLFAVSHTENSLLCARVGAKRPRDFHYHAGHPSITARGRWGEGKECGIGKRVWFEVGEGV